MRGEFISSSLLKMSHPNYTCVAPNSTDVEPSEIIMPVGTIMMWGGVSGNVPPEWQICDGRAVSRQTYADLFSLIGTTYGTGDGGASAILSGAVLGLYDVAYVVPVADINNFRGGQQIIVQGAANATWNGTFFITGRSTGLGEIYVEKTTQTGTTLGAGGTITNVNPSTFNLPDFKGRMPRGVGTSSWFGSNGVTGTTTVTLGQKAGADAQVITADNLPPHKHSVYVGGTRATQLSNNRCGDPNVDIGIGTIINSTWTNDPTPTLVQNTTVALQNATYGINFIIKT